MKPASSGQLEAIISLLNTANQVNNDNCVVLIGGSLESDTGDPMGSFTMDDNGSLTFDGTTD